MRYMLSPPTQAVLAELVGSLQRLLDRYDTAVMLVSLPARPLQGHTPGTPAGGGAEAGPAGGQEAGTCREPRWPVLYVNNAWTALTGEQAGLGIQSTMRSTMMLSMRSTMMLSMRSTIMLSMRSTMMLSMRSTMMLSMCRMSHGRWRTAHPGRCVDRLCVIQCMWVQSYVA